MAIGPIFNCHKIKFSKLDELNPLNVYKFRKRIEKDIDSIC